MDDVQVIGALTLHMPFHRVDDKACRLSRQEPLLRHDLPRTNIPRRAVRGVLPWPLGVTMRRMTGVLVLFLGFGAGCDGPADLIGQAADMAEFSAYYAELGTALEAAEQGWPPVLDRLTDSVSDPAQREPALAAANALVDQIEAVVEARRPDDADTHVGYQAARRMVQQRRAAIAQLRTSWQSITDPFEAAAPLVTLGNQWMAAQQQFMAAAGGHSQEVFGPAAQQAAEGSGAAGLAPMIPTPNPAPGGGGK